MNRRLGQRYSVTPYSIGTLVDAVDDGSEIPATLGVAVAKDGAGVLFAPTPEVAQAVMNARLRGVDVLDVEIVDVRPCPYRLYRERNQEANQ